MDPSYLWPDLYCTVLSQYAHTWIDGGDCEQPSRTAEQHCRTRSAHVASLYSSPSPPSLSLSLHTLESLYRTHSPSTTTSPQHSSKFRTFAISSRLSEIYLASHLPPPRSPCQASTTSTHRRLSISTAYRIVPRPNRAIDSRQVPFPSPLSPTPALLLSLTYHSRTLQRGFDFHRTAILDR